MSTDKDKDLDDLFKKGLADPGEQHTGYREADWERMERLLDGPKKRGIMLYWLPVLGSVAALLLLVIGWWAITWKHNSADSSGSIVKTQIKKDTGISGGTIRQPGNNKNIQPGIVAGAHNNDQNVAGNNTRSMPKIFAAGSRRANTGSINDAVNPSHQVLVKDSPVLTDSYAQLTAVNPSERIDIAGKITGNLPASDLRAPVAGQEGNLPGKGIVVKRQNTFRPVYAISVLAAPDVNGVGSSFTQSKVGTNVGLMFAAGISRKLTISTGALYSVKPYATNFNNYHTLYQFPTNPVNVMADCRMIDIPLNISYQVYHHQQSKISIGTGLSSYLMLHESYNYTYADPGTAGPVSYNVRSPDKYFFGVMNLNATYERQLNSKVGITLQPYLKLPLTNIGYSQVKLQTTGVAVGLTWNLNPLTKP